MRKLGVVLATLALAGCPGEWGFGGRVVTQTDPARLRVVPVDMRRNVPGGDALIPIAGAAITCEGCPHPITIDGRGEFSVPLGVGYSEPGPLVLHVTAPGYKPVDFELVHPGGRSEAGYPVITIVLVKEDAP